MSNPALINNRGKHSKSGFEKAGIYTGSVSAAGSLTNGPSGWSVSGPTSSVFTVTHGLGLTANSYQVFVSVTGTSQGAAIVETRATNAFTVETSDLATPTVADRAFDFIMIVGDGE
jgi:hypothetical protein